MGKLYVFLGLILFVGMSSCRPETINIVPVLLDTAKCNGLLMGKSYFFELNGNPSEIDNKFLVSKIIYTYYGLTDDFELPANNYVLYDSFHFVLEGDDFYGKMYNDSLASSIQGYRENYLLLRNNRNKYIVCIAFDSLSVHQKSLHSYVFFRDKEWVTRYEYCSFYQQFVVVK